MVPTRRKLQYFINVLFFLVVSCFHLAAQTSALTSEGYLRDWQNDGDHVAFSTENGTIRSVMTVDEEKLVLRMYDERHRLTAETVWNDGYETITSETSWTYTEKNVFPETMIKKIPEQKQIVKVLYTEAGCEVERTVFQMNEEGSEDKQLEKTSWQYDDENRVVSKVRETYGESGNHSEKSLYVYTEKAPEPDMTYYEDGVLIEKMNYVSEDYYYDSLYFDGMEIRTLWLRGVKTEEVYYLDGEEIKRKSL